MKRIIFACGGTLGHIMPAITMAHMIKEDCIKTKIVFIMTSKDEKYEFIKKDPHIDEIYYYDIDGLNRKKLISNIKNVFKILKTIKKIKTCILDSVIKDTLIIGMGGYISAIVIKVAKKLGKRIIIHEQNIVMGLANKLVYKDASLILSAFPLDNVDSLVIGNPRMFEARKCIKEKKKKEILITSGSLGSKFINELSIEWLKTNDSKKYHTTLITGKKYYEKVKKELPEESNHFQILPIVDNLLEYMATSSLVVSRAGATTIFEIIGSITPSIVIPSSNVVNNHQYFNALFLKENNACVLLEEKEINIEIFNKYVEYTINNPVIIDNLKKVGLKFPEIDLIRVINSVNK